VAQAEQEAIKSVSKTRRGWRRALAGSSVGPMSAPSDGVVMLGEELGGYADTLQFKSLFIF